MRKHIMIKMLGTLVLGISLMGMPVCANTLHVTQHSKQQIANYLNQTNGKITDTTKYVSAPSVTQPFNPGKLHKDTNEAGLARVNQYRYIAGIPAVSLDSDYTETAQYAALINAANGGLSHTPEKPSGMSSNLYNKCYEASGQVNLAAGYSSIPLAVDGWMDENMDTNLGHRRWILNPSMEKIGCGIVKNPHTIFGTHTAMYVFDNSFGTTPYKNVAWPAAYTPVTHFNGGEVWSVSTGAYENIQNITVTLNRKKDGKKWKITASNGLNVNNQYYGQTGCIMFAPNGVGSYKDGDVYTVRITGLSEGTLSYTVEFFDPSGYSNNKKITVKKVTRVKLSNPAAGRLKIRYGKVSGAKGYQIRYSTKKDMKSAKKIKSTSTTKTVSKLKKGKTYYVQIRAFKLNTAGNRVYGKWSDVKKIKLKR